MTKVLLFVLGISSAVSAQSVSWVERLQHYRQRTFGWQRLAILAGETGFDHLLDEPKEWGREPHTYACRYSAAFGRRLVRNSLELGLGAAFNEDTRFRASTGGPLTQRLRYALIQAFTTSGDDHARFSWARFGATLGAAAITPRWEPRPMSPSLLLGRVASGYVSHLENSLLAEFDRDLRRVGAKVRRRVFGR